MAVNLAEKAYDETHRYQDGLQLTHPQTGDHFGHVIKSSRRKQIHIVIRGTRIEKSYDVVHNLMVCGSRISQYLNGRGGSSSSSSSSDTTSNSKTLTMGYVHAGYLDVAKSIYPSILSALKQQFGLKSSSDVTTFEHLLKDYEIIIVGHSLGK